MSVYAYNRTPPLNENVGCYNALILYNMFLFTCIRLDKHGWL